MEGFGGHGREEGWMDGCTDGHIPAIFYRIFPLRFPLGPLPEKKKKRRKMRKRKRKRKRKR